MTHRRSWQYLLAACSLLVTALITGSAHAKPLGPLADFSDDGRVLSIRSRDGELMTLEFYRPDIVRVRIGAAGRLDDADDPGDGGDGQTPIIISTPQPVERRLEARADHLLLQSAALSLRIHRNPLRLEGWDAANARPLWRELTPVDLDVAARRTRQSLASSADEQFYGGGQHNGRFAFKGQRMVIGYSAGWNEGDRPNPAPFYFSSAGYGVLRNTWSDGAYDFRSDEHLVAEHCEARFDALYIAGATPQALLEGYTALTGRPPLLPRWAHGFGDADCYNDRDNADKPGSVPPGWSDGPSGTTVDVIASVARRYQEHDMPGAWILPNDGYGCGYVDLPRVAGELAALGWRTGLWTEKGVERIAWEVGSAGSRVQKLDVAWVGPGKQFAADANRAAFEGLRDHSDSRPVVWTVRGWAGIQRHSITWTGDQAGGWDFIRWHVPTYLGGGLSGQAYTAADVDGIFLGAPESYTRDLQWKAFTPVLMGMSGWSPSERKHPWWFDEPHRSIHRRYLKLRQQLMPYLYSYAAEAAASGAPIVRALMWDHPDDPDAQRGRHGQQFFFGRDFLVAPVFSSQRASGGWREGVHLPPGRWIDYWDGRVFDAPDSGLTLNYPVTLERIPLLVRAGAIVPMEALSQPRGAVASANPLLLDLYPHGESRFSLYEDDGLTREHLSGAFARQEFKLSAPTAGAGPITLHIGAINGHYRGMAPERAYRLQIHTRFAIADVRQDGVALAAASSLEQLMQLTQGEAASWFYDADDRFGTLHVRTASLAAGRTLNVEVRPAPGATPVATPPLPSMPARAGFVPAAAITVVSRPFEAPDMPLENAFDDRPDTWFRSSRDASVVYGAPEFTLFLGDRRVIDGFDIEPRNDRSWRFGQIKDYAIDMADSNGEWGAPTRQGRLELRQERQSVRFAPLVGRLLRFRVLSTHRAEPTAAETTAEADATTVPPDPQAARDVGGVSFATLHLHEVVLPDAARVRRALTALDWQPAAGSSAALRRASAQAPLQSNGIVVSDGLQMAPGARVDVTLDGVPERLRADLGIDDACTLPQGLRFRVFGDGRLLYDSGVLRAPAVAKPDLDIRTLRRLSLQVASADPSPNPGDGTKACANWAAAKVIGGR